MARTRIDPWQAEQPELTWKDDAFASLIPKSPKSPKSLPQPSPNHGKKHTGPKVILPNTPSPNHGKKHTGPKVILPNTMSKPPSPPKHVFMSKPPNYRSFKPLSHNSSHSKHPHSPKSHSSSKSILGPPSKHSFKFKSKKDEFESAASKVLAALNKSSVSGPFQKPSDFDYGPKIKKRKRLALPDGDKRMNMVSSESMFKVPKVVLRDIGVIISKVCPKLSAATSDERENRQEVSQSPKKSSLVDMPLSGISGPATVPFSKFTGVELETPQCDQESSIATLDDPPIVALDEPEELNVPVIPKKTKGIAMPLTNQGRKSAVSRSEKSFTPVSKQEISFASLASAAPGFLNYPSLGWSSLSKSSPSYPIESKSPKSYKSVMPFGFKTPPKHVAKSKISGLDKPSIFIEENLTDPDELETVSLSIRLRLLNSNPVPLNDCQPSTSLISNPIPAKAFQPSTSLASKTVPLKAFQPITSLTSKTVPLKAFQPSTRLTSNPVLLNESQSSTGLISNPVLLNEFQRSTSLSSNAVPLKESQPSTGVTSNAIPLKESQLSTGLTSNPVSLKESQPSTRKSELHPPVKNPFFGFPEEDGKKLKVRFHVNTNILASSLDLLDLHKNVGMPSGSPSTCSHCCIIFSSVKHCKYHQSFMSSDVASDPSRHNNVQEGGFWLCPWCPLMCATIDLLNRHKLLCRDKGACQQEQKASSLRKGVSNSSRRRSTPIAAANGILLSPNRYKVVHGQVIQL